MATLKQYVAKKRPKASNGVAAVHPSPPVNEDVRHGKRSRARELYHVFAAVRRKHGRWVVPYGGDRRAVACFQRLATRFEALEDVGVIIDVPLFMQTHQEVYGVFLRPYHLVARYAMELYEAALESRHAQEVSLTESEQQQYDTDMVAYLAAARGETVEQAEALLERSGLL